MTTIIQSYSIVAMQLHNLTTFKTPLSVIQKLLLVIFRYLLGSFDPLCAPCVKVLSAKNGQLPLNSVHISNGYTYIYINICSISRLCVWWMFGFLVSLKTLVVATKITFNYVAWRTKSIVKQCSIWLNQASIDFGLNGCRCISVVVFNFVLQCLTQSWMFFNIALFVC